MTQKFRIMECNGNVNRTNRDRPGGHMGSFLECGDGVVVWGKSGRRFAKSVFAKAARREHKRIVAQAIADFEYDLWADQDGLEDMDNVDWYAEYDWREYCRALDRIHVSDFDDEYEVTPKYYRDSLYFDPFFDSNDFEDVRL